MVDLCEGTYNVEREFKVRKRVTVFYHTLPFMSNMKRLFRVRDL